WKFPTSWLAKSKPVPTTSRLFSTRIKAGKVLLILRWRKSATSLPNSMARATKCASSRGKIGGCKGAERRLGKYQQHPIEKRVDRASKLAGVFQGSVKGTDRHRKQTPNRSDRKDVSIN